jgi:hypothetical protein
MRRSRRRRRRGGKRWRCKSFGGRLLVLITARRRGGRGNLVDVPLPFPPCSLRVYVFPLSPSPMWFLYPLRYPFLSFAFLVSFSPSPSLSVRTLRCFPFPFSRLSFLRPDKQYHKTTSNGRSDASLTVSFSPPSERKRWRKGASTEEDEEKALEKTRKTTTQDAKRSMLREVYSECLRLHGRREVREQREKGTTARR